MLGVIHFVHFLSRRKGWSHLREFQTGYSFSLLFLLSLLSLLFSPFLKNIILFSRIKLKKIHREINLKFDFNISIKILL